MLNQNEINASVAESINMIDEDILRTSLIAIARTVKDIVSKTLGPYAHTTIIEDGVFRYPTKDGWNVLKRIKFKDSFYQSIYSFLLQISETLVSKVGDGTTTAFVSAANFIEIMDKEGDRFVDYRQTQILDALEEISSMVEGIIMCDAPKSDYSLIKYIDHDGEFDDIYKIAYLSSNGNQQIASIIQDIYKQTHNPNIYVTIDKAITLEHTIQNGFRINCSLINPEVYSNCDDGSFESPDNVLVAIFNHNVTFAKHGSIINVLNNYAAQKNKTILIMAPHFDDMIMNALGMQIQTLVKNGNIPYIMCAQVSMTMNQHKEAVEDFCVVSDSVVFDDTAVRLINLVNNPSEDTMEELKQIKESLGLDNFDMNAFIDNHIGIINDVKIDKKQLICHLNSEKESFKKHFEKVEAEFNDLKEKNEKFSTHSKEYMEAYLRYSKLAGKMGEIKVGGYSDIEKMCTKDAVDDAVLACKSAYTYGYVKGMNVTLIQALQIIKEKKESSWLVHELCTILIDSFRETISYMLKNKFTSSSDGQIESYVNDILMHAFDRNEVYNLVTDEYEEFTIEKVNVINPAKTDVEILNAIVKILSLVITSNQMLTLNKFTGLQQTKSQYIADRANEEASVAEEVFSRISPLLVGIVDYLDEKGFFKKRHNIF